MREASGQLRIEELDATVDLATARKARGAFFTPPEASDFIVRWGVRSPEDRVLEPSCGEAVFLVSAGRRLAALGVAVPSADQLQGVELHAESVARARALLEGASLRSTLTVGSFFDLAATNTFDVVVGNPPYVRYQGFSGEARSRAQQAALAQGANLTGLASSWAAFLVHAAGCTRPDGRLGMVVPGELLNRNYAAEVRAFLLRRFAQVHLVLFEARVFPGVSEEVVLVLAEGSGGCDGFSMHTVRDLAELDGLLPLTTRHGRWSPSAAASNWMNALIEPRALETCERVVAEGQFSSLTGWGQPRLGMVTGANRYYVLTAEEAQRHEISSAELVPVSPPGSRHLRAITFNADDWRRLTQAGGRTYLFRPPGDQSTLSTGAKRYIQMGVRSGVAEAYKCRVRTPWWRVPDMVAPDLFITYMNHDAVQLAGNGAGVRCLNSVHGLRLVTEPQLGRSLLPLAAMNTLSLLSGELVGRAFGGGMLQVLPREAGRLLVPSASCVSALAEPLRNVLRDVRALLRQRRVPEAAAQVDALILRDSGLVTASELDCLRDAREALHRRRMARSGPSTRRI